MARVADDESKKKHSDSASRRIKRIKVHPASAMDSSTPKRTLEPLCLDPLGPIVLGSIKATKTYTRRTTSALEISSASSSSCSSTIPAIPEKKDLVKGHIELESEMVSDTIDLKWTIRNFSINELLLLNGKNGITSPIFKCSGHTFHLHMSKSEYADEVYVRLGQSSFPDRCWISNCTIGFDSPGQHGSNPHYKKISRSTEPLDISCFVPTSKMLRDYIADNKLTARCAFTATVIKHIDGEINNAMDVDKQSSFSPEDKRSVVPNSGPLVLAENIGKVFEDRYLSDVTLEVGEDEFQAHKIILASRSSVFRGMFESSMKESQENVVQMIEMKASVVKEMLEYIYTGKIEELSMDRALDLYVAADRYDLQELKGWCKDFISQNVSSLDVCHVAELAELHSDEDLAKTVRRVFKEESKIILASKEWRDFQRKNPVLYSNLLESVILDGS